MLQPVPFHPVLAPGGYVLVVYAKEPSARRSLTPVIDGSAVATHYGYEQEKLMLVRWHPLSLPLEAMMQEQEVDGYIRVGPPKTDPVMDPTLDLFNSEAVFKRYLSQVPGLANDTTE